MMDEPVELNGLLDNPAARRLWLFYNALRSLPFDRAIELARAAEVFVTGSAVENQAKDIRISAEPSVAPSLEVTEQLHTEIPLSRCSVEQPLAKKSTRLALPSERRDQLLERLTEGANNAELAAEFGITLKQVQGIRMGCAREIAKRREQFSRTTAHSDQTSPDIAWVEDVVRYLRQQDDVIVPQENGEFLVNGRFHMPLADLVARANRTRARQQKPAFELVGSKPVRPERPGSNGHPLFWGEPAAPDRARDGILLGGRDRVLD